MKRLLLLFSFIFSCGILYSQWVQVGPVGGKVNAFAKDSSTIFAGTGTGISQSTDGGITWRQNNLTSVEIQCFLINDSVILAGGNTYTGIYRSTDHGVSWSSTSLAYSTVYSIYFASSVMFAATEWSGIYKSTDYGLNWTTSGLNSTSVYSFAQLDSVIFCGTGTMGLYYSLDTGKTWSVSSLDAEVIPCLLVLGNTIYAGTFDGVYKSTDLGTTWQATTMTEPMVWTLATDGTNLFAGTQSGGVFLSSDNGTTWVQTSLNNREVHGVASFNSTVFAGTNGYGIYESKDLGQTWSNSNNIGFQIQSLATDSSDIYAGTSIEGIFLSTDNGLNWSQTALSNLNALSLAVGYSDTAKYVYAGTSDGRIWMSTDKGAYWTSVLMGISNVKGLNVSNNGAGPNVYAVGSMGVYTSTDFGNSWVNSLSNTSCYTVTSSGSKVAVGTSHGIYSSVNDGATFTQTSLDSGYFESMVSTRNTMFAGDNIDGWGVYKSIDGGLTWSQTSLNDKSIVSLALAITNQGTMLFAATKDSVLESSDFGSTWVVINDGFENRNINLNKLACNSDYLYAGSVGQSVWRRPMPWFRGAKHINDNIPKSFSLSQNYPNPFNPTTTVKFDIPPSKSGITNTVLKIYDILGREVVTLIDKPLQPGSYKIEWNASGFASGVYFYRLTSGSFTGVKKMVLIK